MSKTKVCKILKAIVLYLWQLPQNLLGLMVIVCTRAYPYERYGVRYYFTKRGLFGDGDVRDFSVSLGSYIIIGRKKMTVSPKVLYHERGHQRQSVVLGWLYLIVIGLPSICGNLYDRLLHTHWDPHTRHTWYHNLPWEHWADKEGI